MRGKTYESLENHHNVLNDTLLYQYAENINKKYIEDTQKVLTLTGIPEIRDNVFINEFENETEEELIGDYINLGYNKDNKGLNYVANQLNIKGLIHIVNRDCKSFINKKDYSVWKAGYIGWHMRMDNLINGTILKKIGEDIKVDENNIALERITYRKPPRSSLPLFSNNKDEPHRWYSVIFPIIDKTKEFDRASRHFQSFAFLLQPSSEFEKYLPNFLKDEVLNGRGLLFILDSKNENIYSNIFNKNLKLPYNKTILSHKAVQSVMGGNIGNVNGKYGANHSVNFNLTIDSEDFAGIYFDSKKSTASETGIKLLYLYPKKTIYRPAFVSFLHNLLLYVIVIIILIIISRIMSNLVVYPIKRLIYGIDKIADGNLDLEIISESKDEIGTMYKKFDKMLQFLSDTLTNIQKLSNNLTGYQHSLDREIGNLETSLTTQVGYISSSNAKNKELNASITKVVQNVKDSLNLIDTAKKQSTETTNIIKDMEEEINQIAEMTQEINIITELINGVSEKTRLLALNAAIEASGAGEAGKGFGVVAAEIRKLAKQSNDAANQIGELIKQNDKRIMAGVTKTQQVLEALNNLNSSITIIANMMEQLNLETDSDKKLSHGIININNTLADSANKNLLVISDVRGVQEVFITENDKLTEEVLKFTLIDENQETIQDVPPSSREERLQIMNESKRAKIEQKIAQKKDKATRKAAIKSVKIYKPKKKFLGLF